MFFLLLGPSGVGKGTIISALKKHWIDNNQIIFPITATTRSPREGEVDGKDYLFMTHEAFEHGLKTDFFLEHAIVHGKEYYGLPKKQVEEALSHNKIIIRELDIQGLWNVQKKIPADQLVSIFIMPPSLESLEQRIRKRSVLPEEEIKRRIASAQFEIEHAHECTVQIVSEQGKIDESVKKVIDIITQYS